MQTTDDQSGEENKHHKGQLFWSLRSWRQLAHKQLQLQISLKQRQRKSCTMTCLEIWWKTPHSCILNFPFKISLFEKLYQTFITVFHHNIKNLEVRQKYSTTRRVLNSLLCVWWNTVSCVWYITLTFKFYPLFKSQENLSLVIILFILITYMLHKAVILWREIRFWSLSTVRPVQLNSSAEISKYIYILRSLMCILILACLAQMIEPDTGGRSLTLDILQALL